MECREFRRLVDAYLKEEIAADRIEEFELHYFTCDACFQELQISETLERKQVPIAAPAPRRFFLLRPALVMTAVLVGVLSLVFFVQQRRQARWLSEVSRFDPPPFIASQSRTASDLEADAEIGFLKAMDLYNQNRFGPALDLLEPLRAAHPEVAKFNFFTGLCRLLNGRAREAIPLFDAIILTMNAAYYDEALYYKGVALLRSGEVDAAKREFSQLTGMFSPLSERAREMIGRIENR